MDRKMVIEVSCMVDFELLDQDDLAEDGTCAVDGSYLITLQDIPEETKDHDVREAVLDEFHKTIPISCLEDFLIVDRFAGKEDDPSSMRASWVASFPEISSSGLSSDSGLPEPTPYGSQSHEELFGE